MTKNTPATAHSRDRAHAKRAISWSTEIAHTRHRWWWYVVVAWAGWVVSLLLYAIGNLTGAILAVVAAIGLIVINVGKPRAWRVRVASTHIRLQRPDRPAFDYTLPLARYKSFAVVSMPGGRAGSPAESDSARRREAPRQSPTPRVALRRARSGHDHPAAH
ncbi:hypothetical protein [Microbacterium lacticum]